MKRPNLFILGAPKCGTTAMARWLAAHPGVFFARAKEPHWFSAEHRLTPTLAAYEALFEASDPATPWAAEASVWYLFSPTAVPAILEYSPQARFVAMVRDPVSMIASMHEQHRFNGNELCDDLAEALRLNDARRDGRAEGVRPGYAPTIHLAYFESCALGAQLVRLFARVPRERVHVVVYDDLEHDPEAVFAAVQAFLGLAPIPLPSRERVNAAKERRSPALDRIVLTLAGWKSRLGLQRRFGLLSRLRRRNVVHRARAPVATPVVAHIRARMRDDVARLSSLLGRDLLSEWAFDAGEGT